MRRIAVIGGVIALALAIAVAWAREDRAVVQIYPTADRLPANLLRVYIVFDRPMSAGESAEHLTLLDDTGRAVEKPFLQLEEELWDASGQRVTVLFDPGRIKRGLRANLESGPPLVAGRRYTLVVDGGWRDANGRPLGAPMAKTFEAVADDRTIPVVFDWTIDAPASGTRDALVLRFPEILDRALLASTISIVDPSGASVRGGVSIGVQERSWTLTPDHAWQEGNYQLRVASELEDIAGNSLRRVFDADMTTSPASREDVQSVVTRAFTITGARPSRPTR